MGWGGIEGMGVEVVDVIIYHYLLYDNYVAY